MYISDNEIIALSDNEEFAEFIITRENLDKRTRIAKPQNTHSFLQNQVLTKLLVVFAWILLFFSIMLLILSLANANIVMTNRIPSLVGYLLICTSIAFFIIDYLGYRLRAEVEYSTNLRTLKELSDKQESGEFHLHISTQDKEDTSEHDFHSVRDNAARKGERIASILNSHNFEVKNALNVGCGGPLSQSASKPYFDKGYDVIGLDVSQEYLKQFRQIFNTDVVQANGIALPFRSKTFDLVNSTDIVEHLHHPFLGLSEAQRVLKVDGIIILTTPNRCAVTESQIINPLIFAEKVIALYCDGILPPRKILARWMGIDFYHTEFSKTEITRLTEAAGFEILSFETDLFARRRLISKIFRRLPAVRFMCWEFVIIGKKKPS